MTDDDDAVAATMASGSGKGEEVAPTFVPEIESGLDATLASGGPVATSGAKVRSGQANYPTLVTVDRIHYAFGKELARGGMGRISVARDRRLGRTVAIKELLVDTPELRARFEREARITANLQHPAIVNILEAGSWETGEPFYVMKLVSGESLDKVLVQRTSLVDRLALLPNIIGVVEALAYAHEHGVIHRDLKPHNILVGDFGEVVVIDWGLAKHAETSDEPGQPAPIESGADQTVAGAVMGTPAYMPLEQAQGDPVDARADVYALGAILYHVFSGTAPYGGRNATEVLARVLAAAPAPIAELVRDLPPDLVTIVEKAMARDARDRYPDAGALAADLRKFQTGQLVAAHRYSRRQLIRRWISRHRAAVAIGSIALVIVVSVSTLAIRQVLEERDTANLERTRAEQQRVVANTSRVQAEELMDFQLYDLRDKLAARGQIDLLSETANKAVAYFAKQPPGTTLDERRTRAVALRNLSRVLAATFDVDASRTQVEAALGILRPLAAEHPESVGVATDLAETLGALADLRERQGDPAGSAVTLNEAIAIARKYGAAHPEDGAVHHVLCSSLDVFALARSQKGERDAAKLAAQEIVATATRFLAKTPEDAGWQRTLAVAHTRMAEARHLDPAGAMESAQTALELYAKIAAKHPENVEDRWKLAKAKAVLADRTKDLPLAIVRMRDAIADLERLAILYPESRNYTQKLAQTQGALGRYLLNSEDLPGALAMYERSVATIRPVLDHDPKNVHVLRDLAYIQTQLGTAQLMSNRQPEGVANLRAGIATQLELIALDPASLTYKANAGTALTNLAITLQEQGDNPGAIEAGRKAVALYVAHNQKGATATNRLEEARARSALGDALIVAKQHDEALVELRIALAVYEEVNASDPKHTRGLDQAWEMARSLAIGLEAAGKRAEAKRVYARAVEFVDARLVVMPKDAEAAAARPSLVAKSR